MEHAYRVLDWQDGLTTEEMPPEWMWPLDEEIIPWFEDVQAKRKEKFGGGGGDDDDERPGMMQNEYARGRR